VRLAHVMIRRPVGILAAVMLIGAALTTSAAMADEPFFPANIFAKDDEENDFFVKWYSKHLKAMKEPSLWQLSQKDRSAIVYRLLWLPTFDRPVSVRVMKTGESATLDAVQLDGRGGYGPGKVAIRNTLKLDPKQWDEINRRVAEAKFWASPTKKPNKDLDTDGDQLIVEGVRAGEYHLVDRHGPQSNADYADLCRHLLTLSGLDVMKTWEKYRE
jgi:hypothetical protein